MVNILLTGATGYIGGEVLFRLANASKFNISALVRDAGKASQVVKAYPSVRIVHGSLDDTQVIATEAQNSDIVLHFAATGHVPSAQAISKGLSEAAREKQKPAHWIQMSGATLYAGDEIAEKKFGLASSKTFDDLNDTQSILSIISNSPKRVVDNIVIQQDSEKIRTALLVGPLIYGTGRGPGNTRSIQAPEIARVTLERKAGFRFLDGQNRWSTIHVHDLGALVLALVEAAASGKKGLWNEEGVYNPENGVIAFGDLNAKIAAEAHKQGLIPSASTDKVLDAAAVDSLSGHASILWGTNAVTKSTRARSLLSWKPTGPSLEDELSSIVAREAGKKVEKSEL